MLEPASERERERERERESECVCVCVCACELEKERKKLSYIFVYWSNVKNLILREREKIAIDLYTSKAEIHMSNIMKRIRSHSYLQKGK